MRLFWAIIPLFAVAFLTATPAYSGQCGYKECWGAIGLSRTGDTVVSISHWSEERAFKAAQENCSWNCAEMRTFKNACASIAQGQNGSWTWAKGRNRKDAERVAHRLCSNRTHDCKTLVSVCSR